MVHPLFRHAEFYTTVNHLQDLPQATGVEIAFAGRSNAGKSSAINTLVGRGRFAFTSKTPGRTQHINFFQIGEKRFMVDLPGYGYAQVPLAIRQHWVHLLSTYLQTRPALYGMILIMDIRHPLTKLDLQMLEWFAQTGKPVHVLLTKADKLSRSKALITLDEVKQFLSTDYPGCTAQIFSSSTAEGTEEVSRLLQNWFDEGDVEAQQLDNCESDSQKKTPAKGD
ncbi:YihA family ribosome biogenesis GTP-binding protein [Nitrosomonas sp. HPC101]|uniref:ribosome biogenesis GTP-binding protein YihA/YsxC n=1 Tax=Nitrosomonas sp. HPC101 TaxID=1658667 RepID=UPI00136EB529|nr:ribosome biogenesis GTP-binding protein YihA/YsxC [Nitrosomonas sp. HPC101]MXS84897.1 YihA family ribosome biogenesis GTP-binding protein [Nitrosomonas sp. HPC101]